MQKIICLSLTVGVVCGVIAYPQNITIINISGSDQEAHAEVSDGTSEVHPVRNDSMRSFGLNEYTGIRMQGPRPEGAKGVGIKDSLKFDKNVTGEAILLFDETHNLRIITPAELQKLLAPNHEVQNAHTKNSSVQKDTQTKKILL